MRGTLGGIFKVLGSIAFVIFVLWGLIIEFAIVNQVAGFWGLVIGTTLLPVTYVVAPWYALIAWGDWFPVVIVYGGTIVAGVLWCIGSAIAGDDD